MQLNSTEIAELIKKRIEQFEVVTEARNEGTIVSVSDGIVRIHGLADVMQGEMIELPGNLYGLALNLERDSVGAIVMGPYADLAEGQVHRHDDGAFGKGALFEMIEVDLVKIMVGLAGAEAVGVHPERL